MNTLTMEKVIGSLKTAKHKPNNPYTIEKNTTEYYDALDALNLSLCSLRGNSYSHRRKM